MADPAGDVRYYDGVQDDDPGSVQRSDGDLTSARVVYGRARIRATLRFRALDRRGPQLSVGLYLVWVTDDYHWAEVAVVATKARRNGRAHIGGDATQCAVKHHIDYQANVATLSFPTRCVGRPRTVLVEAGANRTDSVRRPTYLLRDVVEPMRLRRAQVHDSRRHGALSVA